MLGQEPLPLPVVVHALAQLLRGDAQFGQEPAVGQDKARDSSRLNTGASEITRLAEAAPMIPARRFSTRPRRAASTSTLMYWRPESPHSASHSAMMPRASPRGRYQRSTPARRWDLHRRGMSATACSGVVPVSRAVSTPTNSLDTSRSRPPWVPARDRAVKHPGVGQEGPERAVHQGRQGGEPEELLGLEPGQAQGTGRDQAQGSTPARHKSGSTRV